MSDVARESAEADARFKKWLGALSDDALIAHMRDERVGGDAFHLSLAARLEQAHQKIATLEAIADQAWMCAELDKHNDTPFNEAFDELARLCAEYRPRHADPILVALSDMGAAPVAEGEK